MINRSNWRVCCALILILQFIVSPVPLLAADEVISELSVPEKNGNRKSADNFATPEKQTLEGLIGKSEISVLENVDRQFVQNMAETQLMEDEIASRVQETNLLESIRAGRSFNRESRAALSRSEQAEAKTGQAFGLLLPSVTVRLSSGSETSEPSVLADEETGELIATDTHMRTDAALTVRQPLFDLPRYLEWRRRKVVEQARGENYRVSDGDAYISTVNAYLSLVSSRLQADVTRDFEAQLSELLSYIEKRASAGAASISDMARVRARIQATLSSRLEQESAHATAGIEFIRLTNLVPQVVRLPKLEDVGTSLLPATFTQAVATAMTSNPEIAGLSAELQAARIDKSAAKGRYLPRLDAEYTDTFSLGAGGDESSSGQRDKRIMAVLNWDLFSGGRDLKYQDERNARYKELQYRKDDQRRLVVQALSANYSALQTTRERLTSGYQELQSIATAAEAMSKRMLSGNQSLLDLLDVYDRYFQVRSRLLSLHILEMNAVAQLVRLTTGTPWAAEENTELVATSTVAPVKVAEQEKAAALENVSQANVKKEPETTLNIVARQKSSDVLPQSEVPPVPAPRLESKDLVESIIQDDVLLPVGVVTEEEKASSSIDAVIAAKATPPESASLASVLSSPTPADNILQIIPASDEPLAKKLVLGVVTDSSGVLSSMQRAEQLATYLEKSLPVSVQVKEFKDIDTFSVWFKLYRMVDFAILAPAVAKKNLGLDYLPITKFLRTGKNAEAADLAVVSLNQNDETSAALQRVLVDLSKSTDGRALMSDLDIDDMFIPVVPAAKAAVAADEMQITVPTKISRDERSREDLTSAQVKAPISPAVTNVRPVKIDSLQEERVVQLSPATDELVTKKLVLGVVTDSNGVLRTVQQAELLAAYLEETLPVSVTVREFEDLELFTEWFQLYRMVDLAVLPPAVAQETLGRNYLPINKFLLNGRSGENLTGLAIVPRGQNQAMASELQRVLVEMAQSKEGRALMNALNFSDVLIPEVPKVNSELLDVVPEIVMPTPVARVKAPLVESTRRNIPEEILFTVKPGDSRKKVQEQKVVPVPLFGAEPPAKKLVIGVVSDSKGLLRTTGQAETLARYLEASLPVSITVKEFATIANFTEWFQLYHMVDLAFLSPDLARENLGKDYRLITEVVRTGKTASAATEWTVAPSTLNEETVAQLQKALVGMKQTAEGRILLNELKISEIKVPKKVVDQLFIASGRSGDKKTADLSEETTEE